MPEVQVSHLNKQFADVSVLKDIDFTVREGEFFTLLGPSGCGKSTTLNCIAGLEDPTHGRIAIGETTLVDRTNNTYVPTEERNLGMVFQSYALWPHMTVEANLSFPLSIRRADKADKETRINDALSKVGLAGMADRYPHQLSGGQQQRVALARSLVYSPSVLLLDEPLSNLDAKLREQARAWLKRLQLDLGITTVYVTHDQDEALSLSDRIAVMFDGVMAQVGTPTEIYEQPATAAVAAFVGSCNFLLGTVESKGPTTMRVRLQEAGGSITVKALPEASPGEMVTMAVRPEQMRIATPLETVETANSIDTEVLTTAYVGSRYEHTLRLGNTIVRAVSSGGEIARDVRLTFPTEVVHVYGGDTLPSEAKELMAVPA